MPKIKMQTEFDVPDDVFEQSVEKAIKNNPDYVLVVRCKVCAKISPSVTAIKNAVYCREFRAYMPCDGFCSYGERRNDDG